MFALPSSPVLNQFWPCASVDPPHAPVVTFCQKSPIDHAGSPTAGVHVPVRGQRLVDRDPGWRGRHPVGVLAPAGSDCRLDRHRAARRDDERREVAVDAEGVAAAGTVGHPDRPGPSRRRCDRRQQTDRRPIAATAAQPLNAPRFIRSLHAAVHHREGVVARRERPTHDIAREHHELLVAPRATHTTRPGTRRPDQLAGLAHPRR